jgi:hypothetical protein
MDDLVAFMESLTGTRVAGRVDVGVPATVPSGLDPPQDLPAVLGN